MERPLESRPCGAGLSQVESRGWSTYNSLQVKVTKRFSRSFMLLSSYIYGKVLDIASDAESGTLNAWNFNQDRGPATFDIEHLWTTSWIYELPFGKGKRFGAGWNTLAGWQIGGILFLRTGLPFTVSQQTGLLSTGTGNRPDRIAIRNAGGSVPRSLFDLTAFRPTTDNTGTYGNSGRDILRNPGQAQADFVAREKHPLPRAVRAPVEDRIFQRVQPPAVRRTGIQHRNRHRGRHFACSTIPRCGRSKSR